MNFSRKKTAPAMLTLVLALCLPDGAGATIVTLQPGPEGKDSTVFSETTDGGVRSTWNFGAADYMYVQADLYRNVRRHSFLQFDLPTLSPEDVESVELSLLSSTYSQNAGTGTNVGIGLYKVTKDWVEGVGVWENVGVGNEITYVNQPLFDPTPVATINVPAGITEEEQAAGGVWHVWDSDDTGNAGFADLVRDWVSGTTPNYGLMVRLTDPDATGPCPYHLYRTSDYNWTGEPFNPLPKLEISNTGSAPTPGDANENGIVNDEDASILAAHWQMTGMGWGDGDFNNDQIVNDADASILAANWQEAGEGAAPVPEPLGGVLLATGLAAVIALSATRRRQCRGKSTGKIPVPPTAAKARARCPCHPPAWDCGG